MRSSVERNVRRSLYSLVFWRILGDAIAFPRVLLSAAASVLTILANWLMLIERGVFYLELDAARRYRAIANVDLALATGESSRYAGIGAGVADRRDAAFGAFAVEDDE